MTTRRTLSRLKPSVTLMALFLIAGAGVAWAVLTGPLITQTALAYITVPLPTGIKASDTLVATIRSATNNWNTTTKPIQSTAASGPRLSQPAAVSRATTPTRGLKSGEHYIIPTSASHIGSVHNLPSSTSACIKTGNAILPTRTDPDSFRLGPVLMVIQAYRCYTRSTDRMRRLDGACAKSMT
jgi:hypothetical protein